MTEVKWLSRNSPLSLDRPNLALEGCTVESARHGDSHQQVQHLRGWIKSSRLTLDRWKPGEKEEDKGEEGEREELKWRLKYARRMHFT